MVYRKTWLSYLIWVLYTCLAGVMLAISVTFVWRAYGGSSSSPWVVLCLFLGFACVIGLFFLLRQSIAPYWEEQRISEHTTRLWEVFLVLCFLAAACLYRIFLCTRGQAVEMTDYYVAAAARTFESPASGAHGISYLYTLCLTVVLAFLGNKVMAGVFFQLIIQMITLLLAYFAGKRLTGVFPAMVALFMLSFSSLFAGDIFSLTPDTLFFLFFVLGLFVVGSFVKNAVARRENHALGVWSAILCGLVIGLLLYLDGAAVILLVFVIGFATGVPAPKKLRSQRDLSSEKPKGSGYGFRALQMILSIVVTAVVLALVVFLDMISNSISLTDMVNEWMALYVQPLTLYMVFEQSLFFTWESLLFVFLAALSVLAFWNRRKWQDCAVWMTLAILAAPAPWASWTGNGSTAIPLLIWSVLAGIGMSRSCLREKPKAEPAEAEQTEDARQPIEQTQQPAEPRQPVDIPSPEAMPLSAAAQNIAQPQQPANENQMSKKEQKAAEKQKAAEE